MDPGSKSRFYDPIAAAVSHSAGVLDSKRLGGGSNTNGIATSLLAASPIEVMRTVSAPENSYSAARPASYSSSHSSLLEATVQDMMARREHEYMGSETLKILCATWNVNGQPCSEKLNDWLSPDPKSLDSAPDLYAIGFQELDLSKEAFLFADSPREEEWYQACVSALHPKVEYVRLKTVRLIGMMLIIFVKKDLRQVISNVSAETVGTGLMGRMGNKGGVAVRFDFCNTSFCFVNTHLAAHVEEFERRNQDYKEINNRMLFTQCKPFPKMILEHDQVYWFGDLNYRITAIDCETVKKYIASQDFDILLSHDQLWIQRMERKVFNEYNEGPIRHLPTYKYDPGTDEWDSSEKNRPPAWTDRVLWRGGPTKLLSYQSHPKLKCSDHKPVTAFFESTVKVIDNTKYRRTYQDVMKKLDKIENELLPQVSLDKTDINFETVTFRQSSVRYLRVENTGQIGVNYSFLNKPNQMSFCKSWLQIKPKHGKISPGASIDIELEIFVDKRDAARLNNGEDSLNDILVFHLEHGRDLFISISGTYQPSVFGSSIEFLVRLKTPIRGLTLDQVINRQVRASESVHDLLDLSEDFDNNKCWDIPKEVWILVDHLYQKGIKSETCFRANLFLSQGLETEMQMIRDALDTGSGIDFPCSIHSVAESLLILLDSFLDPVVPFAYYVKALDSSHNFALCQGLISQLPSSHKHVFYYIIAYLRELLRHSESNRCDPQTLATVFSLVMIRTPADQLKRNENPKYAESQQLAIDRKRTQFIYHFLINEFDV